MNDERGRLVIQVMGTHEKGTLAQIARKFSTGANRSDDSQKPDYEGYLSPSVLKRFGQYMLDHQYEGQRASDNWQKGIPRDEYLKSLLRHVIDLWDEHRRGAVHKSEELSCAILFNIQGYLHELLKLPTMVGQRITQETADRISKDGP